MACRLRPRPKGPPCVRDIRRFFRSLRPSSAARTEFESSVPGVARWREKVPGGTTRTSEKTLLCLRRPLGACPDPADPCRAGSLPLTRRGMPKPLSQARSMAARADKEKRRLLPLRACACPNDARAPGHPRRPAHKCSPGSMCPPGHGQARAPRPSAPAVAMPWPAQRRGTPTPVSPLATRFNPPRRIEVPGIHPIPHSRHEKCGDIFRVGPSRKSGRLRAGRHRARLRELSLSCCQLVAAPGRIRWGQKTLTCPKATHVLNSRHE